MEKGQEFLRESYKREKDAAMKALRRHLGDSIVFTGTWEEAEGHELEEEELLEGELSASISTIGCYTVRMAECLHGDGSGPDVYYMEGRPAGPDGTARGVCVMTEVSAKYDYDNESPADSWQNIYRAVHGHGWPEGIGYICTVKESGTVPDGQAALFVLRRYERDAHPVEDWYRFSPDGRTERCSKRGRRWECMGTVGDDGL